MDQSVNRSTINETFFFSSNLVYNGKRLFSDVEGRVRMDIDKLIVEHPMIQNMINCEEVFWLNEKSRSGNRIAF